MKCVIALPWQDNDGDLSSSNCEFCDYLFSGIEPNISAPRKLLPATNEQRTLYDSPGILNFVLVALDFKTIYYP